MNQVGYRSLQKGQQSGQAHTGAGEVSPEDVRKDLLRIWFVSGELGKVQEAGFAWMLPGSIGNGGKSTTGCLNTFYLPGWKNEKAEAVTGEEVAGTPVSSDKRMFGHLFVIWTLFLSVFTLRSIEVMRPHTQRPCLMSPVVLFTLS